ncbi:MAG: bacillithiol biosynthesis cysteine-adding enzyme BshC [Ferruginibacter sp.]
MNHTATPISYEATGSFSKIVLDYLRGDEKLRSFYAHGETVAGIKAAIEQRKNYPTNRKLLIDILQEHYPGNNPTAEQQLNIKQLGNANCFTITTAHQPNIFTGHLYFIYKILHVIKLCKKLKAELPENDFVPVFYMGSEDADLEELGHVYINGSKHEWKTNQTGAVGRMKVDKALVGLLDAIEGEIAVHPYGYEIISLMRSCYTEGITVEQATFKLINALFGEFGLIVMLPDDANYKKAFVPVIAKELKEQFSHQIVEETVSAFPKEYKVQAGGREINMFYLKDDSRDRIEKKNDRYTIRNTASSFSEPEMTAELNDHPERFSPNVILRPVFQEMILPNIAFIGGGGELAYWLELKDVFGAVEVPFPVLVLRNSFLLVEKKDREKWQKLGFTMADLFKPDSELLMQLVTRDSRVQLHLDEERQTIHDFYSALKKTASAVDITLLAHTEALEKQALRKIDALEKKMLRAEKRKFEAQQRQLHKLKSGLFPHHSLQERIENFMPFYAKWGKAFIGAIYDNSLSLEQEFVVLEMD